VVLKAVEISGNTLVDSDSLLAELGEVAGKSFDMAGLNALTDRIEARYRLAGYPFTQAFLPPQDLKEGVLRIAVIEGRFGAVRAVGKGALPAGAQPFLDHALKPGEPIANKILERTLLILDDQPGMKVRPLIRPGARQGEADLEVNVERVSYVSGELGLDNTGARSTGEYRARTAVFINSPFQYGDKISLNACTPTRTCGWVRWTTRPRSGPPACAARSAWPTPTTSSGRSSHPSTPRATPTSPPPA